MVTVVSFQTGSVLEVYHWLMATDTNCSVDGDRIVSTVQKALNATLIRLTDGLCVVAQRTTVDQGETGRSYENTIWMYALSSQKVNYERLLLFLLFLL